MKDVYLSLGTNLGEREINLSRAEALISQKIGRIILSSSNYQTKPVDFVSQNDFINKVILVQTSLSPLNILEETKKIECLLGRQKKSRNGLYSDRTIDIDILYIDNEIIDFPDIQIPHPRLHERMFVLEPLNEIAPFFMHPILQKKTAEMIEDVKALGH